MFCRCSLLDLLGREGSLTRFIVPELLPIFFTHYQGWGWGGEEEAPFNFTTVPCCLDLLTSLEGARYFCGRVAFCFEKKIFSECVRIETLV